MRCVLCGGKTSAKNVEHKEFGVSLGTFRAEVCEKCGETYFDEKTVERIQQKSKDIGLFGLAKKAKVAKIGNSIAIRVPKEIADFLKLKKGEEVLMFPEGKQGLHIEF